MATNDLVIVSWNENGFWQADMFRDVANMDAKEFESAAPAPDDFITMARTEEVAAAWKAAQARWPDAEIILSAEDEEADADEG